MNIVQELSARIEEYRATNKRPCANYATEASATRAAEKVAATVGKELSRNHDGAPCRFVVFYIPAWGRWVACLDFTELLARKDFGGGYLGIAPDFFKY